MSGLLGSIFSFGDDLKKRARGLLGDPVGYANATVGEFNDKAQSAARGLLAGKGGMQSVDALGAGPHGLGGLLGVVRPEVARQLGIQANLPTSPEFSAAVSNTPGAQVASDGLLMRVQRNQLPEQGMMPSVRGGVFYLPEGAAQAKHYSTGKSGYGGSERITGETLVQNPMFAKGGTGGKAPESAYDQLAGKGAYQAMRDDALKSLGFYGSSKADKIAKVESFLDKYAPDMKDMGRYIVENSTKGNQLAYALQEAAVASAVRKAGHDAVLGYSKGKSGPFLSELFDVREAQYPDKFGGFGLHEQYESLLGR
jgi:hypothetical protein